MSTELRKSSCTWFGDVCLCCSLTTLPGPAWVQLKYVLQRLFLCSVTNKSNKVSRDQKSDLPAEGASRLHKDGFGVVLVQEAERLLALLQLLAPANEGPVPTVLVVVENGADSIGDLWIGYLLNRSMDHL